MYEHLPKKIPMPDGANRKKRNIGPKDDAVKRNPNCIRYVLNEIVNHHYEGCWKWASADLSAKQNKKRKVELTGRRLKALMDDKADFQYWHLEAFANSLRIPTGLLLIFCHHQGNVLKGCSDNRFYERNFRLLSDALSISKSVQPDDDLTIKRISEYRKEYYQEDAKGHISPVSPNAAGSRPVTSFLERSEEDKLNPNSLRRILFDGVDFFYGGERGLAAKDLNLFRRNNRYPSSRNNFTENVLSELFRDEVHVSYLQLETFASKFGIPVGFLLLFSRMRSNNAKDRPQDNCAILSALNQFALSQVSNMPISFGEIASYAHLFPEELY